MKKKELPLHIEQQANAETTEGITMLTLDPHVTEKMAKTILPQVRNAFNNSDMRKAYEEYLAGKERNK